MLPVDIVFWKTALEPVLLAVLFGIASIGKNPIVKWRYLLLDTYSAALIGLFIHLIFCIHPLVITCLGPESKIRYYELTVSALSGLSGDILLKRIKENSQKIFVFIFKRIFPR